MRCYGMPEKDAWNYSIKEPDAVRHRPTLQWYKRYLHKCARVAAKQQLLQESLSAQHEEEIKWTQD